MEENDFSKPPREQCHKDFQSHSPPPSLAHFKLITSVGGGSGGEVLLINTPNPTHGAMG